MGCDGDVAILSKVHLLHDLDLVLAHEDAGISNLFLHAEHVHEKLRSRLSFLLVLRVDADVVHSQAKHGLHCLSGQALNLIPVLRLDEILLHHPGSAAGYDLVELDVVQKVLFVYAAGGHPAQSRVGAGQRLQLGNAAVLLGREKFHHGKSHAHGLLHFSRRSRSGNHEHSLIKHIFCNFRIKAGADDKGYAGVDGTVRLLLRQNGSCSNQHVRHLSHNTPDRFFRRSRAEGHLRSRKSASYKRLCQRHRLLSVVDCDDGNDSDLIDPL